jgi:hypothetical protein
VCEYTIPRLREEAQRDLDRGLSSQQAAYHVTYKAYRTPNISAPSTGTACLKAFEAAQLVSAVYAKILDPLRVPNPDTHRPDKAELCERFARTMSTQKLLAALELVAANIDAIRHIDRYQPGTGTNAVRWMQYLATELLATKFVREAARYAGNDRSRLRRALHTIGGSVSALDRFSALGRGAA